MDLVELTKTLVNSLISDKDKCQINLIEEDKVKIIQVLVDEKDISTLIGKKGVIANSLRTIVQAAAYNKHMGPVRINIDTL